MVAQHQTTNKTQRAGGHEVDWGICVQMSHLRCVSETEWLLRALLVPIAGPFAILIELRKLTPDKGLKLQVVDNLISGQSNKSSSLVGVCAYNRLPQLKHYV